MLASRRVRRPGVTPYSLLCVEGMPGRRQEQIGTGGGYLLLFLLGVAEGMTGSFQFARSLGSVPVVAMAFCVLIFATCALGGAGMGSPFGGLVPGLGWFAATLVLSLPTPGGSVIITNTTAGKWYLYGGAVAAGLGIAVTFYGRMRRMPDGPGGSR